MTQAQKSNSTGIKTILQKIDSQILKINKQISQNSLTILNLKNQSAKLKNIFQTKTEQIERNIKIDVQKFEEQIQRNYKNHNNSRKMLEKKVKDIENSQLQLTQNLYNVQLKVKNLQESLG